MASAVIHLAIAKKLEKNFSIKNRKDYYLGAIAPDISKQIGRTKHESHFLYNTEDDIPNINMFKNKYENFKDNDFNLGYYLHLVADKLWFEEFFPKISTGNSLKLLDGTIINTTPEQLQKIIYSDYTNINIRLIDEFQMDLSLFYEEFSIPKTQLTEIPIDKLNILIDKMGIIIENSKNDKNYTFDMFEVNNFIDQVADYVLKDLEETLEII